MPTDPAPSLPVAYLPGASGRSAVFRPIAERLARRRPPHFVDYPGFGVVPADPSIRTVSDLARHVLDGLPDRVDLVAMSMGGAVALRLALEHPERVRSIVLIATSGGVDVRSLGAVDWREAFRKARPDVPPLFLDDAVDLTARLAEIAAPTLLVYGDQDLIAPVAVGRYLLERLPSARLEVVEGATHDIDEDHPDLLASFIEAHLRAAELAGRR